MLILSGSQATTWVTNISQLVLQGVLLTELVVFTWCRKRPYEQLGADAMKSEAGLEG